MSSEQISAAVYGMYPTYKANGYVQFFVLVRGKNVRVELEEDRKGRVEITIKEDGFAPMSGHVTSYDSYAIAVVIAALVRH